MDKKAIQEHAKWLRRQVYENRHHLWPGREAHPLEMLEPDVAAQVLGVNFSYEEDVTFRMPGVTHNVGGLLHRATKSIVVATRFGVEKARFTAAHELGHWLRHPNMRTLHRDFPIDGADQRPRDPIEREADVFAAMFLMPAHMVSKLFRIMFGTDKLVFNDTVAYNLSPANAQALVEADEDSLTRERALASAKSFASRHYQNSLAGMFKVSDGAMAIRIKELELVEWP